MLEYDGAGSLPQMRHIGQKECPTARNGYTMTHRPEGHLVRSMSGMNSDCSDQVVLVTGGSSGLGRAIALESARRGAKAVIINYSRSAADAEETAEGVRREGATAIVVKADVSNDAECRTLARAAEPFGRIDALFNNAGITRFAVNQAALDAVSAEDFLHVYKVNLVGAFPQHHDALFGACVGSEDQSQRYLPRLHRYPLVQARHERCGTRSAQARHRDEYGVEGCVNCRGYCAVRRVSGITQLSAHHRRTSCRGRRFKPGCNATEDNRVIPRVVGRASSVVK